MWADGKDFSKSGAPLKGQHKNFEGVFQESTIRLLQQSCRSQPSTLGAKAMVLKYTEIMRAFPTPTLETQLGDIPAYLWLVLGSRGQALVLPGFWVRVLGLGQDSRP